ncbi:MAG: IS630 transposase-related protein [Limisphaerales bacterium]
MIRAFEGQIDAKAYSDDLRVRAIEAAESGASRREATESFSLSASSAVKWLQRWHDNRSASAKPTAGPRRRWRSTRLPPSRT